MTKTEIAKGLREAFGEFLTLREVAAATKKSRNRVSALTAGIDCWKDGRIRKYHADDVAAAIARQKTPAGARYQ